MLKVIIADDEDIVCKLIKHIIPWDQLGYSILATVNNGIDAYQEICRHHPDVVITDVRMPGYDGIELIKHVHESGLHPEFIIISGYQHFEYAHGALQLGVKYYLLKPVNREELSKTLNRIKAEIIQQKCRTENENSLRSQIDQNRDILHRQFIMDCIFHTQMHGISRADSLKELNRDYQTNFVEGIYQSAFIKLDTTVIGKINAEKILQHITEEATGFLQPFCVELVGTAVFSGGIFVLNYRTGQEQKVEEAFPQLYAQLRNYIDIFNCFHITIGLSNCRADFRQIKTCISEALEAVEYRIKVGKEIIRYSQYQFVRIPVNRVITLERENLLQASLQNCSYRQMAELLDQCRLEINRQENLNPAIYYELANYLCKLVQNYSKKITADSESVKTLVSKFNDSVENAVEERVLWNEMKLFLSNFIQSMIDAKEYQEKKPIRMAEDYINRNYMKCISLETVANYINLSPTYLCTVFRKETGVNFSEYLIQKRLQEAQRLLINSTLNIEQISNQVGYANTKYFSKLFNRAVGLKPSEYRRLYS